VARDLRRRQAQLGAGRAAPGSFHEDVVAGLSLPQKSLPPKYFYDAKGSRLFERICRLPEYYPTRTELRLTRDHLGEIVRFAGKGSALLEYGSGEGLKTRVLIRALRPSVYIPIDISAEALARAARRLKREFPQQEIAPVPGDFSRPLKIPFFAQKQKTAGRKVVYFPGSTIGNLTPDDAQAFLRMTRGQVGPKGAMLVGVDLKKDPVLLHQAYNDSRGVTAAFNLNLLERINRELQGDFDLRRWRHYSFYNAALGRIEMHLASLAAQTVNVGDHRFRFERGETIHTENSYKYSVGEFQALAVRAGFKPLKVWTDRAAFFSLHGLTAD
jgi:dimethylhistidine N-methyltransferase